MTRLTYRILTGLGLIILALVLIFISPAESQYDRQEFGGWRDSDQDCINTRHEVLASESLVPPLFLNCKVITGLWFDPFTGLTFTDPTQLDVDHLVPLKEAYISGAHLWTEESKRLYANDLENPGHLIAVDRSANRSKGSKDPSEWMPTNQAYHCAYVLAWIGVKDKWNLSMDEVESWAIEEIMREKRCR